MTKLRFVRWLLGFVGVVVILVGLLFIAARFHDGPLGLIPGGALQAGAVVSAPVSDWKFADVDTIEMQLESQSSSRTTWILVSEGRAFIPASLSFPPGKTWPKHADADGRATLRIAGQRYPVTLTRVQDEAVRDQLKAVVGKKYRGGPPGEGGVWFFEVVSRAS